MLKKSLKALSTLCILLSCLSLAAGEEMNWDDGYRIFQDHSPNFVHVEILNVTVHSNKALWFASSSDKVEIEARILKVIRTKNDLRPGMIIPIVYNRKAAAGGTFAETPGIPEKGAILPAFIKIKGDHFAPAARHHTFTPLAEQQLKKLDREAVELSEAQIAALRLPQDVSAALQMNTTSNLPLEEPATILKAERVEALSPSMTASTDLPIIDDSTPGLITPTIPDTAAEPVVETVEAVAIQQDVTSDQYEPNMESVATETIEATEITEVTQSTPEQPVIDTGSEPVSDDKPTRRTVVVIPPSQLRARRQAQVQTPISPVPPEPATVATVMEPEIPVLKAEIVVPELAAEVATPGTPPEVTVVSSEPAITVQSASLLESEPEPQLIATTVVAAPERDNLPAEVAQPIKATANISTEVPVATPETSMPMPQPPALEEPVTITDFTPAAPSPVTVTPPSSTADPSSALSMSETDRENMKSYADIYLSLQQANNAAGEEDFETARTLYQKSLQDLQTLKAAYPDFQPFMVEYRIRDTGRKLEQIILKTPKKETVSPTP
jgi:hypothetical protein